MTGMASFPAAEAGRLYLTEGGVETELMYKWGYELPKFALYPLLEDPAACETIRGIYRRYLDVAAGHGFDTLFGGFDYRASPDWGRLLGYSAQGLHDVTLQGIDFLRDLAREYDGRIERRLIAGYIGPRGDAYGNGGEISVSQAEDYHAVQLETLKAAGVDLAWAMTFNNVPEAMGLARAARRIGVPLAISFTLNGEHRLNSGPTLAEAVTAVEAASGGAPAFYTVNCSHPIEFEPAIEEAPWMRRVRSIRPNAAKMDKIALCKLGRLEEGDPVELGRQMGDVARRWPQMDIWGACCGTGEVHLAEIARNVRAVRRGRQAA